MKNWFKKIFKRQPKKTYAELFAEELDKINREQQVESDKRYYRECQMIAQRFYGQYIEKGVK